MKRKILSTLCFWAAIFSASAQLTFDRTDVDMGQLGWYQGGNIVVRMTNTGTQPLEIADVLASSCQVKAEWPHTPIAAGGTAALNLSMDGALLGRFDKAVHVYVKGGEKPYVLRLRGEVVTEVTDFEGDFPYIVGDVMLSTDNIEFDDASSGELPVQVIDIRNVGQKTYIPQIMHLPEYLTVSAVPERILPGRAGKIYVTLNSQLVEDYGLKQTTVYLSRFPGDKVGPDNEILVSSVILPPFDTTSVVRRDLAPVIDMPLTELDLTGSPSKAKISGSLVLKNKGKSMLEITSLQTFHPALDVSLSRQKLAPGQSARLRVAVVRKYLTRSRSRLRVLMTTNDAKTPKLIVTVNLKDKKEK